jgi:membrane-bound serine protease (ClpP class)
VLKGQRIVVMALLVVLLVAGAASAEVVHVVSLKGEVQMGMARFAQRALQAAQRQGATKIILEIDSVGGRVDAALLIKDAITESPVPVFAYVKGRALSAAALIALSTEQICMQPGSTIGAAEPRPNDEKTVSALREEFVAAASMRGKDPLVAAAMVDKNIEIEGLVTAGQILTLDVSRALTYGIADFQTTNRGEVFRELGVTDPTVVEVNPKTAERIAGFVTSPVVSSILLTVGFLGLIVEIATPGFGVAGTAGLIALGLFFGGHMFAGLAGFEVVVLFIAGLVLLILEAFVIPGFGVPGVLGLLCIFSSIFLAFADPQVALYSIIVSIAASVALFFLLFRQLKKAGRLRSLILSTQAVKEEGYISGTLRSDLQGKVGTTTSVLRPAGTIEIDGERVDVLSAGEFIEKGVPVEVMQVSAGRILVRKVANYKSEE